jgi:hypothetical protein
LHQLLRAAFAYGFGRWIVPIEIAVRRCNRPIRQPIKDNPMDLELQGRGRKIRSDSWQKPRRRLAR